MKRIIAKTEDKSGWTFAIINGKLAEIYFETKKGKRKMYAHCYVKRKEYKTKKEQEMIDVDIQKYRFT